MRTNVIVSTLAAVLVLACNDPQDKQTQADKAQREANQAQVQDQAKADQKQRTLAVGEHHTILQKRRREQKTEPFKQRMKHRNAIEGTQSELVRAHGLRRARYRSLAKVRLQNYFIGAACNVKRWLRRAAWELQSGLTAKLSAASTS